MRSERSSLSIGAEVVGIAAVLLSPVLARKGSERVAGKLLVAGLALAASPTIVRETRSMLMAITDHSTERR